jgi:hypothetical protein
MERKPHEIPNIRAADPAESSHSLRGNMLRFGIVGVLLVWTGIASAQIDPDEALQKIKDREATAATQPSDQSEEIATLKSVIPDQAKQIDALKAEIVSLRQQYRSRIGNQQYRQTEQPRFP